MDVNEEIVKEWLHLCKNQFTIESIIYKVPHNYGDIDILAIDKQGNYYDYEIKWRSQYSFSSKNREEVNKFINQINRKERKLKVKQIIGNKKYQKILVTTHVLIGKTEKKKQIIESWFNKKNIKIIYFEDIIDELINKIEEKGIYKSPVSQTIRMLKYYKKLNS